MVAPFEVRCELTPTGPPCPAVAAEGVEAVALFDVDVEDDEDAAGAGEAGAADSDAIGVDEAGALDAAGVDEVAGAALFVFEELRATTTRAKITIPAMTAITTREDDFELEASFAFPTRAASLFTLPEDVTGLAEVDVGVGTDEREYEVGTGGMTIEAEAEEIFAELRFAVFFADLRTAFLAVFFAVFLTTRFATFLADDFFADFFAVFLAADFFAVFLTAFLADFFAVFLTATFAPLMTS
jgi:hypothetical protein